MTDNIYCINKYLVRPGRARTATRPGGVVKTAEFGAPVGQGFVCIDPVDLRHIADAMNAEELRQLQAPLKARYQADPRAARVTLRALGHVAQSTVTCAIESGKPGLPVGLHPAAGGDGLAACSGDMLLEALVGCAGVTLAAVATAMGIELRTALVSAEGDLDFRGTLGVARDVPVGFSRIRLRFEIDSETPAEKLQKLVELTERYCVVLKTLAEPPAIELNTTQLAAEPAIDPGG